MAIITTYICDVSGVQGDRKDFVNVSITANPQDYSLGVGKKVTDKFIHKDVALKLGLIVVKGIDPVPESTLESKLLVLLKDYVQEIAYEAGYEAAEQYNNR